MQYTDGSTSPAAPDGWEGTAEPLAALFRLAVPDTQQWQLDAVTYALSLMSRIFRHRSPARAADAGDKGTQFAARELTGSDIPHIPVRYCEVQNETAMEGLKPHTLASRTVFGWGMARLRKLSRLWRAAARRLDTSCGGLEARRRAAAKVHVRPSLSVKAGRQRPNCVISSPALRKSGMPP